MEFEKEDKQSHQRDKWFLAILVILWLGIIAYTNFKIEYLPSFLMIAGSDESL